MQKETNTLLSKTKNGQIYKCPNCNKIHVEFNNLNFNFSQKQFDKFTEYILNLNGTKWEEKNKASFYQRKIIIPIGHNSFNVLLNNSELIELKQLFNISLAESYTFKHFRVLNLNFTHFVN